MPLYTFVHNVLNVPVQIANKMGLQNKELHHPVLYNPDTESNVKYPTEKNNGLMKNK
jgi:hypothetical protein